MHVGPKRWLNNRRSLLVLLVPFALSAHVAPTWLPLGTEPWPGPGPRSSAPVAKRGRSSGDFINKDTKLI